MKTLEKTDSEIKTDVLSELKYQPSVKASDIGVLVHEGAVTLNGFVGSYGEKWDAVNATKRVRGVSAIADDIKIKLSHSTERTDSDIAADAANQIKRNTTIPAGGVQVTVREGWITLEGVVEWRYQYIAVQDVIKYLPGVKWVTNLITIKPKLAPVNIETSITAAIERNALLNAKNIQVEAAGGKVILRGMVRYYAEREEAERVAWAAPGVISVDNQLKLEWSFGA